MSETITISGTVRRVFFCNPESPFMAGVLDQNAGNGKPVDIRFAGPVAACVGDKLELTGEWGTHPKFGLQFQAATGVAKLDESPDALAHLLATKREFENIGPARAKAIVDAALRVSTNGEVSDALVAFPDQIAEAAGVDVGTVRAAAAEWADRKRELDTVAALVDQGWGNAQAKQLFDAYGETAPNVVRQNPYALVKRLARFGFKTVDAVALKMGIPPHSIERMMAGVAYVIDRLAENGHTRSNVDEVLFEAEKELMPDTFEEKHAIGEALDRLIADGSVYCETWKGGTRVVASTALLRAEIEVFQALRGGLLDKGVAPLDLDPVADILDTLNAAQLKAVVGFSSSRFSVVSGGAGTGKTYTMDAVAQAAEASGLSVALCAPTGKAARKLADSTGRGASTIHRLLDPVFVGGEFRFNAGPGNPIPADLIIVDEVSMVDVRLMRSLLLAMRDDCRLLLVGDHNQIPSVGAGAVLRDVLRNAERFPDAVHVLDEVVRQAGRLALNTAAILDGKVDASCDDVWRFERTEHGHEGATAGLVADLFDQATIHEGFDPVWGVQAIAPMKGGPCGVNAINAAVQARRQRHLGNPKPEKVEPGERVKPLPGDRIIWTKNDYELGLMNGTQAIVREFRKGGAVLIETEDGEEKLIDAGKRKNIEVAYCMTIHKSQGSEWPCVILSISSKHYIMRDRNLLYTGCSRAATQLTIVGDAKGVKSFASAEQSKQRRTFGGFILQGWECPSLELVAPLD